MKAPMSSEELAQAIESLVAEYVEGGRRAAMQAVEVAFARARVGGGRPTTRPVERSRGSEPAPRRRTQAELEALTERLFAAVRAAPGESMARFAEELGLPSAELQRPMSRLRDAGRVRSVGERHLTRYFPAVGAKR
jgi:hypothetical protein